MDEYPNRNPNDAEAWAVDPPEERVKAEEAEKTKVSTSIGVIEDVLEWFDKNADMYGNIDALNITPETEPLAALAAISTAKGMRAAFQSKASSFRSEFSKYLKEKADAA